MIQPLSRIAGQAIQNGCKDLAKQAQKVAEMTVAHDAAGEALPDALVQSKLSQTQIEAAVKLLQAADETLGSLLDIKV